jgi:hypothetical protein
MQRTGVLRNIAPKPAEKLLQGSDNERKIIQQQPPHNTTNKELPMTPLWATIALCIASGMMGYGFTALIAVFKPTTTHTN